MTPMQRAMAIHAMLALRCQHGDGGARCRRCTITLESCIGVLASQAIDECEQADTSAAKEAAGRFIEQLRSASHG